MMVDDFVLTNGRDHPLSTRMRSAVTNPGDTLFLEVLEKRYTIGAVEKVFSILPLGSARRRATAVEAASAFADQHQAG